jgi:hypothetical protein
MVNMEGRFLSGLRQLAILTPIPGSLNDKATPPL